MGTLSQEDRFALGQHFCIGFNGSFLPDDFQKFAQEYHIGGIIYFKHNYESPAQLGLMSDEIQKLLRPKSYQKLPTFIAIDHEGGRVQRLGDPFTRIPPMAFLGKKNSPTKAFDLAEIMAKELAAVGINITFAPVLDVAESSSESAIGDRSLSTDPEIVAKVGSALVRGFQKGGVISVPKHFPGHGLTKVDSHATLPTIDKTLADIEDIHMMPFKRALRARCEGVMMGHLKFPKVDPSYPVSLSKIWIQDVFRSQMRFQKLVFSDDMEMGALTEFFAPTEAALCALQATTDILVYKGSDLNALSILLDHLIHALEKGDWSMEQFHASTERIAAVKRSPDFTLGKPTDAAAIREIVGCSAHQTIVKSL